MNILVANTPNESSDQIIFTHVKGADESMKEFTKMVILLAMKEHRKLMTEVKLNWFVESLRNNMEEIGVVVSWKLVVVWLTLAIVVI